LANWIKKKIQQSATYRRLTSLTKISTARDERLEEDLPRQWPLLTDRGSNTYLE
jgi:hypothetical protein